MVCGVWRPALSLWSANGDGSDAVIQTFTGHTNYVLAVAFYPDGKEAKFVNAVLDHMAREAKPEAENGAERLDRSEVDELMQRMEGMLDNENDEGFSDDDGVSG